jgi:hypothetical protein
MIRIPLSFCQFVTMLAVIVGVVTGVAPVRAATPVSVDNSTAVANAIAKALQTGEPFEASLNCSLLFTNVCSASYSVPTNQRLVLEYVSFTCPSSAATPIIGQFVIYSTGAGVKAFNAVTLPENAGNGFVQLGQPVKIYVDPASVIVVTAELRTGAFSSSPPSQIQVAATPCSVTLNGRQIPD